MCVNSRLIVEPKSKVSNSRDSFAPWQLLSILFFLLARWYLPPRNHADLTLPHRKLQRQKVIVVHADTHVLEPANVANRHKCENPKQQAAHHYRQHTEC
jgi:hypothetical protein